MQPASAWGDDLMITHKTWVEGPVRVFNFSVAHTPSYFAGQDSLWVHNANGECKYSPSKFEFPEGRQKPPNSPDVDKWLSKPGYKIEIEEGGIRYINADGVGVLYRNDLYPDFKSAGAVLEEVKITMVGDHDIDYKRAKDALRKKGYTNDEIRDLWSRATPHHFEDQATIQFVDKKVHKEFTHRGAVSDIKNGVPPVTY